MINTLTSFRFFAAFIVYLYHSVGFARKYDFGYMGVSFFFILSGFIMAYNYHSKFTQLKKETIKMYYIARFAKIYPVHFLTLLISIPYMFLTFILPNKGPNIVELFSGFIANFFLIQSFIPLPFGSIPYSFNQLSWSLSTEGFFYVSFPFLIYLMFKIGLFENIKKIWLFFCIIYSGIVIVDVLFIYFKWIKIDDWFLYVFPLFRSLDFIIGILLGLLFLKCKEKIWGFNRFKFYISFLECLVLAFSIIWIMISPHANLAFKFSTFYIPMWCLLIFVFAFQGGILSEILSNKILIYLGDISFSFYMVHLLVINFAGLFKIPSLANHIITLGGSLIISSLIYFYYEEPMRKRIRLLMTSNKMIISQKRTRFIKN